MVCSRGVAPCSSAFLCVLLLVFIVTMTTGQVLENEEACLAEGGICVVDSSCPKDKLANKKGLCLQQEDQGAVCCNGIPEGETSCRFHGGNCEQQACQNVQSFGQLDCQEGSQCCLLLK